ncbi:MAG TPA: hypothetical protein VJW76_12535 [Verrucomicrobiae bacterium]|nr:hypothetical protein [Verrucomicrobiae bacterium]
MKNFPEALCTFAALATLAAFSTRAVAQDKAAAKLPPAKEVIAKFVQAIGGKEIILKQTSQRIKGKWELAGVGQGGDFEMLRAKPNKQVLRVKLGDQGQIVNGYDGKVGWMLNPFTGPMLLEGKMLDQASEEAEFYNILREEKNFKSMETAGVTQFDGKEAIELKLVTKSGREIREFYDAKTGLLIGTKAVHESPQGPNELTITFHDYKKMGEVLQSSRFAVKGEGFEQILTISSVEDNSVPEKEFDLPEEIKGLLKK